MDISAYPDQAHLSSSARTRCRPVVGPVGQTAAVVTASQVRAVALGLPRAYEAWVRDRAKFRVGRLVFLSIAPDERSIGFGYPKDARASLVAAEPEKFFLPIASDMRYHWVRAWLDVLDEDEMHELVTEAWAMVVPKRVAAEYFSRSGSS